MLRRCCGYVDLVGSCVPPGDGAARPREARADGQPRSEPSQDRDAGSGREPVGAGFQDLATRHSRAHQAPRRSEDHRRQRIRARSSTSSGTASRVTKRRWSRKMKSGQLDGAAITAVGLGQLHPPILVLQLPGLFTTLGEARQGARGAARRLREARSMPRGSSCPAGVTSVSRAASREGFAVASPADIAARSRTCGAKIRSCRRCSRSSAG